MNDIENPGRGDHITMEQEQGQASIAIPVDSVSQIELGDEHYVTLVQNGQVVKIYNTNNLITKFKEIEMIFLLFIYSIANV